MSAKLIDFETAAAVLADDANARSRPFLERVDQKTWRIAGLFAENEKLISQTTFLKLANEHKITSDTKNTGHFLPV